MHGTYTVPLVVLSFVIALLASYTALTLTGRVAASAGGVRLAWLLGGSISMGTGIWSMHFAAMLAFELPIQIGYSVPLVALSLLAAIGASALALIFASRATVRPPQLVLAVALMGSGIAGMHYVGMAAIRMSADLVYDWRLVTLSLVIAFTASALALWIFRRLRNRQARGAWALRTGAAVVLAFAITGLHYTGMSAAHFMAARNTVVERGGLIVATDGVAAAVVIGTLVILLVTLLGAIIDHWVSLRLSAEAALREREEHQRSATSAAALRDSEERYRSVVNEVNDVIFRTDETGCWTFLNPAWTDITGFTLEESQHTPLISCVHPDDRAAVNAAFQSLADGSQSATRHEVRYATRAGDYRWIEVRARVNRTVAGVFLGTAGSLQDLTERRQADALRADRANAQAANLAKSEFLSRMSHELRTPLNAILGFGQLLEIEEQTPENRESIGHILKGGRHLLALINEVLDMSGIEAGHLRLVLEPVEIGEVLGEVLDLLQPLAAQRAITMRTRPLGQEAMHVLADRQRLKQVLLNLVSNAIKYNSHGGSVDVECQRTSLGTLRTAVMDSGAGIAPDKLLRLFTPFERLGAEHAGIEGTGLGLALSKRLMEAMGGSIGAESTGSAGSTFWLELPLADDELQQWERMEDNRQEGGAMAAQLVAA